MSAQTIFIVDSSSSMREDVNQDLEIF